MLQDNRFLKVEYDMSWIDSAGSIAHRLKTLLKSFRMNELTNGGYDELANE